MFVDLFTVENGIAFLMLAMMEIVLGIDNLVYIAIVSSRLPEAQQPTARRFGLAMALVTRLLLLFTLSWIVHLSAPVFTLTELGIPEALVQKFSSSETGHSGFDNANGVSWRDMALFAGGLFLLWNSVREIHKQSTGVEHDVKATAASFSGVVVQIAIMDMVFSLDSVITAVGMAENLTVMAGAIILAVVVMLVFAEPVSRFVSDNPTLKMLALSFLILIGVMLMAEGIGAHLDKAYIYFAMAFALGVEILNLRAKSRSGEVKAYRA